MVKNAEIAKILYELAMLYEMKGVPFKPRALERASETIDSLAEDVVDIYKKGGIKELQKIQGVGLGIAEKIEEYENMKKKFPVDIAGLSSIEGVGPKHIAFLYEKLKIKTVSDLERAAKAGKLRGLPRMGEKLEAKILKGIAFKHEGGGRFGIGEVLPLARSLKARLSKIPGVETIEIAGSNRCWEETIGDLDFLVISESPEIITNAFSKMPEVDHVYAKGPTKVMVRLKTGIDADLIVLPKKSFGAALQYFTGSKDHNVEVRKLAIKKGWSLNEHGLTKGKKVIVSETEEEIYEKLGMQFLPPEIRLNRGEIDAAIAHKIPKLIGYGDLKGDLQIQTDWTDGKNSIEEMAREAEKLGHEYIAITDHTHSLAMTGGADEKKLERQIAEIEKINAKFKKQNSKLTILKGAEVNIMKDGSLDIDDKTLAKLDVVGAAVHSLFNLSR